MCVGIGAKDAGFVRARKIKENFVGKFSSCYFFAAARRLTGS